MLSVFFGQESEKLHIKQIDHHHQELASLQASHSEKIASLTRKYKNDMQLWQKEKEDFLNTIEELEGTLQKHRSSDGKHLERKFEKKPTIN